MPSGLGANTSPDDEAPRPSFVERVKNAMLKPAKPGMAPIPVKELSREELEEANTTLNDRERVIGLIAAPIAALLTFIVTPDLASHDTAHLSTYKTLFVVMLVLSLGIMALSLLRKRMFLGIALALFGVGVFNLHYPGFGVPFVLAGAWYLVRAYRITQALKVADGTTGDARAPRQSGAPRTSKRYTPPTKRRRPAKPES